MILRRKILPFMVCAALGLVAWLLAGELRAGERLICCGGEEVFVIAADDKSPRVEDRIWRWTAADSLEIPREHWPRYRTTDECKPYGNLLLITSSSHGVALVRRVDKACLFFTLTPNAHSACLLPGQRIAVAASTGGDELRIYDRAKSGASVAPLARRKLRGAHGAWWDAEHKLLWALGTDELVALKLSGAGETTKLELEHQAALPTTGGHELSPARDGASLCITTEWHAYRFDLSTKKFTPYDGLANAADVKSIDEHPTRALTVYHQAAEPNWWSDQIRFVGDKRTIRLEKERLYKIRWDVPRAIPE